MKTVSIDRKRKLRDEPHTGHNRWHPDIPPVIEVDEGEEVALETRDALDGHLHAKSTEADFASMATGAIHPLTGPVLVKGARPGDLLEVEFTINPATLAAVDLGAIAITGFLGATTIVRVLSARPARLLRQMGAD